MNLSAFRPNAVGAIPFFLTDKDLNIQNRIDRYRVLIRHMEILSAQTDVVISGYDMALYRYVLGVDSTLSTPLNDLDGRIGELAELVGTATASLEASQLKIAEVKRLHQVWISALGTERGVN